MQYVTGTNPIKRDTISKSKDEVDRESWNTLQKWANVLHLCEEGGKTSCWYNRYSPRNGLAYTHRNATSNLVPAIEKAFGVSENKIPLHVDGGNKSWSTWWGNNGNGESPFKDISIKDINAKIYLIKGSATQGRIIYKTDENVKPTVEVNFIKEDFNETQLTGATIKVEKGSGVESIDKTSLTIGSGKVTVRPQESSGTFELNITETGAPSKYSKMEGTITLVVSYNSSGTVTGMSIKDNKNSNYIKINKNTATVTIKNKPKIDKISLLKVDSQDTNTELSGATFNITLTNVESIGSYSTGGTKSGKIILTGIRTGSDGGLYLNDLVIADETEDVTIVIEETSAPVGYKKINGKITVTLKRNGNSYTTHTSSKDSTVLNSEFTAGNVPVSENQIALTIKNIPVMNLGGVVFVDGQESIKQYQENQDFNQIYDNDEGLEKVKVELVKSVKVGNGYKDIVVSEDVYGRALMTESASNGNSYTYTKNNGDTGTVYLNKGQYVFANIEKGDYYAVRFTYDGINYQTIDLTKNPYDNNAKLYSKVAEYNLDDWQRNSMSNEDLNKAAKVAREEFNSRFKEISFGQSNDGTTLTYNTGKEGYYNQSKLDVSNSGEKNFKISAISYRFTAKHDYWKETWDSNGNVKWNKDDMAKNSYQMNINCGLYKKELDLQLGTELVGAKLTINGKETDYIYDDVTIGQAKQNKYNLYLFASDYNFRINSYRNNPITGVANESGLKFEDGTSADFNTDDLKNLNLEAKVTYKIKLENATPWHNSRVDEIAYYYDKAFTNPQVKTGNYKIESKIETNEKNVIILKHKDNSYDLNRDSSTQKIEIEFTVVKDPSKDNSIILKDNCTNVAEINKYSTEEGGLIDRDSAPGNAKLKFNNGTPTVSEFEDDTWQSNALNIKVKEEQNRTISGTVWNDGEFNSADGIFNGETGVDGVIVQLIEIVEVKDGKMKGKDVNGIIADGNYEYIWQETVSGRNSVKYTPLDGTTPEEKPTYDVTVGTGEYCFNQNIIPGNYIIRFIYGDGTTYDLTDNVKTYNGQDYKSTIDSKYNKEWYNTASYTGKASVARDNEARRLEVMAYSSTINKEIGEALRNKSTLDKTWMCAETSKINVMIDEDNAKGIKTEEKTEFKGNNDKANVTFDNINFGLAERPRTNLVLEKHITGLKITPNGTGVQSIVDAKANIEGIIKGSSSGTVDGGTIDADGVTQGLAAIKSTRGNRGFWQVATDVEELAQGAELEVEYTYVIRNDGDNDYLSDGLVDSYIQNPDSYSEILKKAAESKKISTKGNTQSYGEYLGEYYYLREIGNNDKLVPSRVETLEEALNNSLTFDETSGEDFSRKTTTDEEAMKTIYDTNGITKKERITTIIENVEPTDILTPSDKKDENGKQEYENKDGKKTADYSKKVTLRTVLSSSTGGELGANLPSYIAEVVKYSNAAGRRDMDAEPDNLAYVHSDETAMTLDSVTYEKDGEVKEAKSIKEVPEGAKIIRESNQRDEFWGESIIITKPTGEDKITPMQIAIITVSSMAVLGVGIVLIKKFVLKK